MRQAVAVLALAFVVAATALPAGAQTAPTSTTTTTTPTQAPTAEADESYLSLDHASPWVSPDGQWTATWTVAKEPPADAELQYTIHQPLSGDVRASLASVLHGASLGPGLQREIDTPLAQLRTGDKVTLDIDIRSHSGSSDRVLVPNPGILPIDVELTDGSGNRLQRNVLFLNRLPTSATHSPLRVAPRVEVVSSTPVVDQTGNVAIPQQVRGELDSLTQLLRRRANLPITVAIDPELLTALKTEPAADDAQRLSALRAAVRSKTVLRSPWSPLDIDDWGSTGTLADVQSSLLVGQATALTDLGATTENRIWAPDPTLGPGALRTLAEAGIEHLVLSPSQLEPTKDPNADDTRAERVAIDSSTSGIDALVDDPTLTAQLGDTSVSAGMSAHLIAAELESIWLSTPNGATPAVSLDLSSAPSTVADDVADDLSQAANPTITVSSLTDAFAAASTLQTTTSKRRTTPVALRLATPTGAQDVTGLSNELRRLRPRAAAYRATMNDPQVSSSMTDLMLESQHRALSVTDAGAYLGVVDRRITTDFAKIQPPPPRSVTLTVRKATLPVQLVNGLDRTVTVRLRFRGIRLGLRSGATRAVKLQPGQNSLTVPVVVRTSGDFTMTIEVLTADNGLLLGQSTVQIRSTVVSGVGVFLGGGALLFLVLWWLVTIRRDRRRKAAERATRQPAPAEEAASLA